MGFVDQVRDTWVQIVSIIILVATVSCIVTVDPDLEKATFGESKMYLWVGVLGALNGVSVLFWAPVLGALSDLVGRSKPLIFCYGFMALPSLICIISGFDFWVYYWCRAFQMIYGPAFSLLAASIVDKYRAKPVAAAAVVVPADDDDHHHQQQQQQQQQVEPDETLQRTLSSGAVSSSSEQQQDDNDDDGVEKARTEVFALMLVAFSVGFLAGSLAGTFTYNRGASAPSQSNSSHSNSTQSSNDSGAKAVVILQFVLACVGLAWISIVSHVWPDVWRSAHQADEEKVGGALVVDAADIPPGSTLDEAAMERQPILQAGSLIDDAVSAVSEPREKSVGEKLKNLLSNKGVILSTLIVFLDFISEQTLQSQLLLYLKNVLNFSPRQCEALLVILAVMAIIGNVWLIRPLRTWLGLKNLLRFALVCNAVSIALFSFLDKSWQAYTTVCLAAIGTLVFPSMTTLASLYATDDSAGAAQGLVAVARFVAEGIAPAVSGVALQKMNDKPWPLPGTPFLGCAASVLIALAISFALPPLEKKKRA